MGRSVGFLRDATETVYLNFWDWEGSEYNPETEDFEPRKVIDMDPENWFDQERAWEDFTESITYRLTEAFPSLVEVDRWVGREGRVILENSHCAIVLFEYMGSVSVNLVPELDGWYDEPGRRALAQSWCLQVADKFRAALTCEGLGTMIKQGTMSNGVSVYQRICN